MTDPRNTATIILLEESARFAAGRWFVPGGEIALAWGIASAHPDATVIWQPIDSRERDAVASLPGNLVVEEPGATGDLVDSVVMASPPERALARRWLLQARGRLEAGGRLIVAGANEAGVKSVLADAARLFGKPVTGSYRAKHRIAVFQAHQSVFAPEWAIAPGITSGSWEEFALNFGTRSVPMVTQPGVFAGARVDAGTRLLLDTLPEHVDGAVLDIGCGAGVIGIAAAMSGAAKVTMTDVNLLAVQAATENTRRLDLVGVDVVASDAFHALGGNRYDLIVSNPPFHRGKAVDFSVADRLIAEAPAHLAPGGALWIVANAFLAYGRRMERVFQRIETVRVTRQYHVLRAADPR